MKTTPTGVSYRCRDLLKLRWRRQGDRLHRRSRGHRENTQPSVFAHTCRTSTVTPQPGAAPTMTVPVAILGHDPDAGQHLEPGPPVEGKRGDAIDAAGGEGRPPAADVHAALLFNSDAGGEIQVMRKGRVETAPGSSWKRRARDGAGLVGLVRSHGVFIPQSINVSIRISSRNLPPT